eukprot:10561944-Lingulodinium_polyedra.AAC.1
MTAGSGPPTELRRAEPLSKGSIPRGTTYGRPAPTRASRPTTPCCPRLLTGSGACGPSTDHAGPRHHGPCPLGSRTPGGSIHAAQRVGITFGRWSPLLRLASETR